MATECTSGTKRTHVSAQGVPILHILSDGSLEEHEHAIGRLIERLKVPGEDMFRQHEAVIADAYARQGNEIAYREDAPDRPGLDGPRAAE